jgi:hypothetical protein
VKRFGAVTLFVIVAVTTSCSKKQKAQTEGPPSGATVDQFAAMLEAGDAASFKAALEAAPKAMRYDSGHVFVDLAHPWFQKATCNVDQRTGVATGGCMFIFRTSVKGREDELADAFAAVHPELSPPTKRITDAVTNAYKIDLGEAGGWEPGGPLFVCSMSSAPECKRISVALVKAKLPAPGTPAK